MPGQRGEIDGDLALGIAVVGIDADHFERPVAARRRHVDAVADRKLQAPRQLFADEAGIAGTKPGPGVVGRLQQRPVVAIGGVIGQAEHLDRRAVDLRFGAAARQDRLDFGALAQPRLDLGRLRIVGGVDIDVRRQPAVEPDRQRSG